MLEKWKISASSFPEFSFPYHAEQMRRSRILRKTTLTHDINKAKKNFRHFCKECNSSIFFLWWELHFFMPQNACRFNVDNTLPWHLAVIAGSAPAGLSPERGQKKLPCDSKVCNASTTERRSNIFFPNIIFLWLINQHLKDWGSALVNSWK